MSTLPPDRDRESDPLGDFSRRADPGLSDAQLEVLQDRWDALAAARRVRRRAVAAGLAVLMAGGVAFVLLASRDGRMAGVPPSNDAARRASEIPSGGPSRLPTEPGAASPTDSATGADGEAEAEQREGGRPDVEAPIRSRDSAGRQHTLGSAEGVSEAIEAILLQLESVEPEDRHRWQRLVVHARQLPRELQHALSARVTEAAELPQRGRAMRFIVDASGAGADRVLLRWLDEETTRRPAWEMLLERTGDENLQWLVSLADRPDEREQVCRRIVQLEGSVAADWLVRLTPQQPWRPAIAQVSEQLEADARSHLLSLLGDGSSVERAAAGFVIGTLPGSDIDQQLATMIAQGRSRQAAYLALFARRTPAAEQFLFAASRDVELAPALHSAQYGWRNFGPLTKQWLSELEEKHDDVDSAGQSHDPLDRRIVAGRDRAGRGTAAA